MSSTDWERIRSISSSKKSIEKVSYFPSFFNVALKSHPSCLQIHDQINFYWTYYFLFHNSTSHYTIWYDRENAQNEEVEVYREVLNRYTLKGARDFLKTARRLEKERRNDEFLTQKMIETDSDLVMVSTCHLRNNLEWDNITIVTNRMLTISI